MSREAERRYQVHHGLYRGDRGYVVVDAAGPPAFAVNRRRMFTSDSEVDARAEADRLNEADRLGTEAVAEAAPAERGFDRERYDELVAQGFGPVAAAVAAGAPAEFGPVTVDGGGARHVTVRVRLPESAPRRSSVLVEYAEKLLAIADRLEDPDAVGDRRALADVAAALRILASEANEAAGRL